MHNALRFIASLALKFLSYLSFGFVVSRIVNSVGPQFGLPTVTPFYCMVAWIVGSLLTFDASTAVSVELLVKP